MRRQRKGLATHPSFAPFIKLIEFDACLAPVVQTVRNSNPIVRFFRTAGITLLQKINWHALHMLSSGAYQRPLSTLLQFNIILIYYSYVPLG